MGNSLALCMIIKNEQQFLPYCLASVYKFCDEIVIVDTGSTDRSIEIAEAFGAYVIQVKWKDDFSLVRNISQSPAKSDWIIWLDGDEVLSDSGAKKIKQQLLLDASTDFFLCPRVNFWKTLKKAVWYPDYQTKLYRNNIGLRWKGSIHEKIFDENNPHHKRRIKHTDVHTFHYAYVKTPDEVKKKMQLYIHIENPDMDPRQIERCSTEHSFFYQKEPDGVQDYSGSVPEIFQKLIVTQNEIKWVDGPTMLKFKTRIATASYDYSDVENIVRQTPQKQPLKTNYSTSIKDLTSIVIATHNKIEYLQPLINGIYQSTHIPFELIVVDNGSTESNVMDALLPMEKERENFKFVHLDKNYGFAKGYNEGLKVATGEWLCVLNNDTLVTDGWLDRMVNHLKEDPEIAIIAPVSNNMHGEHQMLAAPEGFSFGDYIALTEKLNKEQGSKRVYSSWITGCCMVFNRALFAQLEVISNPPRNGILFCEDFPVGMSEDSDLCFTILHRLHKKLGVARDVFLWHHGQKTLSSIEGLNWRELQHANNLILRKRWPEIFPEDKK